MKKGKQNKIVEFKRAPFLNFEGLNVGIAIFGVIFVYIIICIIIGLNSKQIVGYQVKNGMLSENKVYEGIALRKETVVNTDYSGYVNFYVREGERAAFNNLIYTIDESGKLSEIVSNDPAQDNSLEKSELNYLQNQMKAFSHKFTIEEFTDTYTFKDKMNSEIMQIANSNIMADIDTINSSHIKDMVNFCKAKAPGIVLFYTDGYEQYTTDMLEEGDFEHSNYEPKHTMNNDLIEAGTAVYKYIDSEVWEIAILVDDKEITRLEQDGFVKIKFLDDQTESWAQISFGKRIGDKNLVTLKLNNSMVDFCKDRYIDIELMVEEETGLKIPNSAITENSFFMIPKEFFRQGGNSSAYGLYKKVMKSNGEYEPIFIEASIYKKDEDEWYVDMSPFDIGDTIIYIDSNEIETSKDVGDVSTSDVSGNAVSYSVGSEYTVGKQGTLIGVYNINKGYAEFKRIEILYQNEEYSIVKPNDVNSVQPYDYIALDSSVVTDKDFVYQK